MDYKGQTAVLSAFFLVGMIFLVPAITEKALAGVDATATGTCVLKGKPIHANLLWIHTTCLVEAGLLNQQNQEQL